MRADPYQLVEGLIIAAFAVSADGVFICLKRSFERELEAVTRAVQELQAAGIFSDCAVTVVAGPDELVPRPTSTACSPLAPGRLGSDGQHRHLRGPARAEPNARQQRRDPHEHLTHPRPRGRLVPFDGTAESPDDLVATVVGDVVAPDVGEIELGTPLGTVIGAVGSGLPDGRTVKAVFSGVANPVVTAEHLGVPVSYEGFQVIGSGMGAGVLRAFPEEFAGNTELGRCPRPRQLPIPKLFNLADGCPVYDESLWRKQPDWTYEPGWVSPLSRNPRALQASMSRPWCPPTSSPLV